MSGVEVEIYSDEVIVPQDFRGVSKKILGIGCLFVPMHQKALLCRDLLNLRCLFDKSATWTWDHNKCGYRKECKLEWHMSNMCEVHHEELRKNASAAKKKIAQRWLNHLVQNNKNSRNQIYFNLLYIELDKLKLENFGEEHVHNNIYNRFYRSAVSYGIKTFFNNNATVKRVYHDQGSMEKHKFFPRLNLKKLDKLLTQQIVLEDYEIKFVDSDHKKYLNSVDPQQNLVQESNLIQFIDLILGTTTQNIFYLSDDNTKKETAMIIRPLIERMLKNPTNRNSSYNYYKKQHISFFPKEQTSGKTTTLFDETIDIEPEFYYPTKLAMPEVLEPEQEGILQWC